MRLSICYPELVWLCLGRVEVRDGEERGRYSAGREVRTMVLATLTLLCLFSFSALAFGTTAVMRAHLLSVFCRVRRKLLEIQLVGPDTQKELQVQPGPPYLTSRAGTPFLKGRMSILPLQCPSERQACATQSVIHRCYRQKSRTSVAV